MYKAVIADEFDPYDFEYVSEFEVEDWLRKNNIYEDAKEYAQEDDSIFDYIFDQVLSEFPTITKDREDLYGVVESYIDECEI